jgi:hypothetical protein
MSNKQATILFADIADCSEVSNNLSINDYAKFLQEFHETAYLSKDMVLSAYKEPDEMEFSIKGDEACLILHKNKNHKSCMEDVQNAIIYAIILKLNWFVSKYNQKRVRNSLLPRGLGIGIHHGAVFYTNYPHNFFGQHGEQSSEGYSINLAKRIEGTSRDGKYSKIHVSEDIVYLTDKRKVKFYKGKHFDLKGITTNVDIFEIEKLLAIESFLEEIKAKRKQPRWGLSAVQRKYIKTGPIHAQDFWLDELLGRLLLERAA